MEDRYLELEFNVTHRARVHARYADGDHLRSVNLKPIFLFNKDTLTSSSVKEKEEIHNAHVISLKHKLLASSREKNDLSNGSDRSIEAQERYLTNNKTTKRNYHVRIFRKIVFCFAELQRNSTFGLGYQLALQ